MARKDNFKILAPVMRPGDIKTLKSSGASELFCGYVPGKLSEKWPVAFNVLNRRGDDGNITDHETFKDLASEAGAQGLPLFVTVNGLYTPEQYPLLMEMIGGLENLRGVEGVIIADVGLLLALKKMKFKKEIHMGTGGTCFNSATADLYAGLGASRVTLDRQMTGAEIRALLDNIRSGIGTEIFIHREGCGGFIDGFCTFFHCQEHPRQHKVGDKLISQSYNTGQYSRGCEIFWQKDKSSIYNVKTRRPAGSGVKRAAGSGLATECRICDLYELKGCSVTALKIVGRGCDAAQISRSVRFVAEALSYLGRGAVSRKEYTEKCQKLYSGMFNNNRRCSKYNCYFSPRWTGK